jgi:hypothetical protein
MSIETEVKKVTKSKWTLLVIGIVLGGTVLAGVVATIISHVRSAAAKVKV